MCGVAGCILYIDSGKAGETGEKCGTGIHPEAAGEIMCFFLSGGSLTTIRLEAIYFYSL